MVVLQALNIDFSYNDKNPLFYRANLTIKSGEIIGLLGPNGSGKTTFFDLVCKLKTINSGTIIQHSHRQVYLSQTLTTPPSLRMFDVFKMITLLASDKYPTLDYVLSKLDAWCPRILSRYKNIWNKKSSLCSYGEKRWFFTLTLLSLDANLIVLDEPTAGVDAEFRHYIWQCLKGASSEGAAILLSSHNIEEVANNCNGFYTIIKKRFLKFENGQHYIDYYNVKSLDEAFICSASET